MLGCFGLIGETADVFVELGRRLFLALLYDDLALENVEFIS